MDFAIRRSRIEQGLHLPHAAQGSPSPLLCQEPNCVTSNGRTRPANKSCGRLPKQCSQCCKANGGCSVHRVISIAPTHQLGLTALPTPPATQVSLPTPETAMPNVRFGESNPQPTPTAEPPAGSRQYARPLDPAYAKGYVEARWQTYDVTQRFEADQKLSRAIHNTVQVTFWYLVRLNCYLINHLR